MAAIFLPLLNQFKMRVAAIFDLTPKMTPNKKIIPQNMLNLEGLIRLPRSSGSIFKTCIHRSNIYAK